MAEMPVSSPAVSLQSQGLPSKNTTPGTAQTANVTQILRNPKSNTVDSAVMATPMTLAAASQGGATTNGTSEESKQSDMANTKEKTPMCLINELARYNKIIHTYALTDEQGPAHRKTFFVKLKLGSEEYAAQGPSIKKAQHNAAEIAIQETKFSKPVPRLKHNVDPMMYSESGQAIYPTVELNALAMKRGEPAIYQDIGQTRPTHAQYFAPNLNFRGMYNQRYHYPRPMERATYISLKVGNREFIGEGETRKAARHNAAVKALRILRNLPLPSGSHIPAAANKESASTLPEAEGEELKSEISLVYEIALKRDLNVNFEVTRESGPPHLRSFITRCTVGHLSTEAEGNSKKLSKKKSAEEMLEKLKQLPPIPNAAAKAKVKTPQNKKKNRNLIKVQKASPDYGNGINPVSRLIQIQQAKKEKEPIYTCLAEKGLPRKREFFIQVTVGSQDCTGRGPNKRLAKRNAAENMLAQLGYSKPMPQPGKPAIKTGPSEQSGGDKKVKFSDQDAGAGDGHGHKQIVPGILVMKDNIQQNSHTQASFRPVRGSVSNTTVTIAKELLDTGLSPTAEAYSKVGTSLSEAHSVISPKYQLLYLAEVMGFKVQFTDFPKGNNRSEFLSLVSLSTNPPQVSHGGGPTLEASHDMAALTALKALAEMGLESALKSVKTEGDSLASGDGLHLKEVEKSSIDSVSHEVGPVVKAETC